MPLDRFVLIVVLVVVGAGLTVAVAALVAAWIEVPVLAGMAAIPLLLLIYVVGRAVADRVRNAEDTRYDHIEK